MKLRNAFRVINSKLSFTHITILAFAFRLLLIVYAQYHDAYSVVKYTDVDYRVFSDAARFILNPTDVNRAQGFIGSKLHLGDPYSRSTYRYTPLLALFLVPNEWVHPAFGKIAFAIADVLIGVLLRWILENKHKKATGSVSNRWEGVDISRITRNEAIIAGAWLLNPLPANISTRGSSEALLGLMVIGILYTGMRGYWNRCAALLGLSIHWKIYPLVYVSSLLVFIGEPVPSTLRVLDWLRWFADHKRLRFLGLTAITFVALSTFSWLIWGSPFLEHSYLYHIGRTDHRHNFSIYFYSLYLGLTSTIPSDLPHLSLSSFAFIPQIIVSIGGGALLAGRLRQRQPLVAQTYKRAQEDTLNSTHPPDIAVSIGVEHLPFIFFLQTLAFVTLNKVCTSQYFMWYLWFLPLIIPRLIPSARASIGGVSALRALMMGAVWVATQALWLSYGYRLEFLGEPVFLQLWLSGAIWFASNAWILAAFIDGYQWA